VVLAWVVLAWMVVFAHAGVLRGEFLQEVSHRYCLSQTRRGSSYGISIPAR